jgi:hypothetical protein
MSSMKLLDTSTRLITERSFRSNIPGQLPRVWLPSTVPFWSESSLPIELHKQGILGVPTNKSNKI